MIGNTKIDRPQRLRFSFSTATAAVRVPHDHLRSETSANACIHWLCNRKLYKETTEVFHSLQSQRPNFLLTPSTYRHLFVAASLLKSAKLCRQIHQRLSHSATRVDVILQNHILTAFGKCGCPEDAREVFDGMLDRNVASWTAIIAGYACDSRETEAMELYMGMRRWGIYPGQFALGTALDACSRLADPELGKQLHGHVLKLDVGSEKFVRNALLNMYAKSGCLDDASMVFARITDKDVVCWGALLSGLAHKGDASEALRSFQRMLRNGDQQLNEVVFESVLRACGVLSRLECGEQVHGLCVKAGVGRSAFAATSLLDMYAKCGMLECSRKVFDEMRTPDLIAWNSIIGCFSPHPHQSLLLFSEMRTSCLKPDDTTVRNLLAGFGSHSLVCQGRALHSYICKIGLDTDAHAGLSNSLLTMYSRCCDYSSARLLFEEIEKQCDVVTLNAFLGACLRHERPNEVLELLKRIHGRGIKPDGITCNIMLRACAELCRLEAARQIHAYSSKLGVESDLLVTNCLIDAYAKCGHLGDAEKSFRLVSGDATAPDVVSWSSLICGHARFGHGREALALFREMQMARVKPNQTTFVGVLSACGRVGMVEEGRRHFEAMQREHGIAPTLQHFSCMIDMLCRAGILADALRLTDGMPFEPDAVVWKTLLNACRVHGNVEMGEKVAEAILKMDPLSSTAHSLLCGVYASAGDWNGVARLRSMMRRRSDGMVKSPGKSWINVRDEVHTFAVEDRTHPQMEETYQALESLALQMDETILASSPHDILISTSQYTCF